MHNLDLILTLTSGLTAALLLGYATHRLGLSPLVGYLLAGLVVGPNTPGFTANRELAEQMAEIGVILLMFGVGLHFHLKELLAVWHIAVPGAIGQSLVATGLGCALGVWLGWGWQAGVVFGLAISVASTVVLLRVLADNNDLHTPAGHIAIGWLVVEDLFTVLVLVLMPVVFRTGPPDAAGITTAVAGATAKITVLVIFIFLVGGRVIPWLLNRVAATRSRELFTLAVLVLALGIAVGAARLFGVSMALGAFLAGMVVGQSDFSSRAASEALPMRDAFAVLFFVSVGMLFKPMFLVTAPSLVALTLAIVLIGKPLAALAIVLALGHPIRHALSVAIALAQIGEFSFILAAMGRQLQVLPENASHALIAAAIVSISLNPLLYRMIDALERHAKRTPRLSKFLKGRTHLLGSGERDARDDGSPTQVVIVGYGPVGRTLVHLLQESEIQPAIVELNMQTVQRLKADGLRAIYGDATHKATMLEAGIEQALAVVFSSSGMHNSEEAIRVARECNPDIRVFARANYLREGPALERAGADAIFADEGEVALSMTEFMLRQLGATAEQIDRARDRIRKELFGTPYTAELLLPVPLRAHAAEEPAQANSAATAEQSTGQPPEKPDPAPSGQKP